MIFQTKKNNTNLRNTNLYEYTNYENGMETKKLVRDDLIYPELSYKVVGWAYGVFNQLGPGHSEKIYQRAYAEVVKVSPCKYSEQVYYPLTFQGKTIGKSYFDFLIDEKIIVELKKNSIFSKTHIDQVLSYLKVSGLKLAIIINFTNEGVKFKRIININNS